MELELKITNYGRRVKQEIGKKYLKIEYFVHPTSKFDMKGVHEIAKENGRVAISGHAAEVGIIGKFDFILWLTYFLK